MPVTLMVDTGMVGPLGIGQERNGAIDLDFKFFILLQCAGFSHPSSNIAQKDSRSGRPNMSFV